MENAYRRKKQPKVVRQALLDNAVALVVTNGLSALTVQAVADGAGVTKGGFLHHFPHKQALVDAVFAQVLSGLDEELDAHIAADPEPWGAFTRAYLKAVMGTDWHDPADPRASLSMMMLSDPRLRDLWAGWFNARLLRHADTDTDLGLTIVRLAADGIWLGELARIDLPNRNALRRRLLEATREKPAAGDL